MVRVDPTGLYDVDELAVILNVTPDAIRRQIRRGVLPGRKVGRKLYVVGAELLRAAGWRPLGELPEGESSGLE